MGIERGMAPAYQLFCVVTPRLGASGLHDVLLACGRKVLTPRGDAQTGVVTSICSYGAQQLAYPMRETGRGRHTQGWMARMRFVCAPSVATEMSEMLNRDESVLRHIVRREELVPSLRRRNLLRMRQRENAARAA